MCGVSLSQSRTDISFWRIDNKCVCIHKMYSDITGETQIFILRAGIGKCNMFTITGINMNMTAKMRYGILSHVNILLHLLVGFSHLCHLVFLVLIKIKSLPEALCQRFFSVVICKGRQ